MRLLKEQMAELDRSEAFDADQHLGNSQDNLNSEIRALRAEIAALKAERAQNIVVTPVKKPWAGELDYEHPEIESIAKAIHKRLKDLELPEQFNYSAPNKKGDLSEVSLL